MDPPRQEPLLSHQMPLAGGAILRADEPSGGELGRAGGDVAGGYADNAWYLTVAAGVWPGTPLRTRLGWQWLR